MHLKLSAKAKKKVEPRIDVSDIKSAANKKAFQLDLQNRFEAFAGLDTVNEGGNMFATQLAECCIQSAPRVTRPKQR